MSWWLRLLGVKETESIPVKREIQQERVPFPSGRLSNDGVYGSFPVNSRAILPPADHESFWRIEDLDTNHLDSYKPQELLDMLIDISPEVSKAVWDFIRMCNPGYDVKVYALGTEKKESLEGTDYINSFLETLRQYYGSVDVIINRIFIGGYLRGALDAEIVLDSDGDAQDLVTPDPYSIRFRRRIDPVRGQVWEPGQMQNGKFVSLEIPTFRYIPVDPVPASPYGRSLAGPSLFTALFLLSVMHDIKRVIMQQGYKRMDIEIDMELARDAFTYDDQGYATLGEYVRGAIENIRDTYASLQPDDAFIHSDIFKLAQPAGTVDSDSIGAIDQMTARLEKMITRALKSNGLIMDTSNNTNEADSNRRWEIHAAGIKSIQHLCENLLESLLNTALQARGIQAKVQWRFAELRASEMLRDEQTMAMRIQNARNMYAAGYSSQDEASNYAVNHDADQPEPREEVGETEIVKDNNSGNEALDTISEDRNALFRLLDFSSKYANVNGGSR